MHYAVTIRDKEITYQYLAGRPVSYFAERTGLSKGRVNRIIHDTIRRLCPDAKGTRYISLKEARARADELMPIIDKRRTGTQGLSMRVHNALLSNDLSLDPKELRRLYREGLDFSKLPWIGKKGAKEILKWARIRDTLPGGGYNQQYLDRCRKALEKAGYTVTKNK